MSPSKYEPEAKEPLCMGRRTKSFRAGSIADTGRFGFGAHTPWEEFQSTITKPKYQRVIDGTSYPHRHEFTSDAMWTQALDKTERTLKPKAGVRLELQ